MSRKNNAAAIADAPSDSRTALELAVSSLVGKRATVTYCSHSMFRKEAEAGDTNWAQKQSGVVVGIAYELGRWNGQAASVVLRYGNTNTLATITFRKMIRIEAA